MSIIDILILLGKILMAPMVISGLYMFIRKLLNMRVHLTTELIFSIVIANSSCLISHNRIVHFIRNTTIQNNPVFVFFLGLFFSFFALSCSTKFEILLQTKYNYELITGKCYKKYMKKLKKISEKELERWGVTSYSLLVLNVIAFFSFFLIK